MRMWVTQPNTAVILYAVEEEMEFPIQYSRYE
jgi:hypothetical protein